MTKEPIILDTIIENPGFTSSPAPPLRKKHSLRHLHFDPETGSEADGESVLSAEGSVEVSFEVSAGINLKGEGLEPVQEIVEDPVEDEGFEDEDAFDTPATPPRRRLRMQAHPVCEAPTMQPPPRPSSSSHTSLNNSSLSLARQSSLPGTPPSNSTSSLPQSPAPPPPFRASRSNMSINRTSSVNISTAPRTLSKEEKQKKPGLFARMFNREGDASKEPEGKPGKPAGDGETSFGNIVPKKKWYHKMCITIEAPKLEQIKKWTVNNYKFTKQLVSEKFGHSTKTVDKDLGTRIEELRASKQQYANMLREARTMYTRFEALVTTHRNIRAQFQTLIAHAPDLQDQLQANATTQSILEKNGEGLLGAIKQFGDTLNTLVNVTIQDTLLTIKNYENARIEYDAYRNEVAALQNQPQTDANTNKLLSLQVVYETRKKRWEKLKTDSHTKLDLLGENRSAVMKSQLEMFNTAVIAYFSGNGDKLSEVLSEYHIKAKKISEEGGDTTTNSFLARNE